MSKKALVLVLGILVLIGLYFFVFLDKEEDIPADNIPAAAVLTDAEKQILIKELQDKINTYLVNISELEKKLEEIKNTPIVCPEPLVETQTIACPIGQTGSITQTRTKSAAPICEWGGWTTTSSNCVADPISDKFSMNDRVQVQTSTFLNVRATPDGSILGTQTNGALGTIVGGSVYAGGHQWWNINYDSGADGWSAEVNLEKYVEVAFTCPTSVPKGTFRACYYDNKDFTGFKYSKEDSAINFNWGNGSPASMGTDTFSIVWEGDFIFDAGVYNFSGTSDDGIRVYVDGEIIINYWSDHSASTRTALRTLTAGTHRVKVEYYENSGQAVARASWTKQDEVIGTCSSPLTETQTINCPSGQTGTITQERTKSAYPSCSWSGWTTVSTNCTQVSTEPTPTPPPSGDMPSTAMSNEPAGMTKLKENPFNCLTGCSNGWGLPYWMTFPTALTITSESTPHGDGKAAQITFNSLVKGGTAPGSIAPSALPQKQDIYVATWIKLSENFRGHSSGVNKVLHFYTRPGTRANNIMVFAFRGSGTGTIVPSWLTQNLREAYTYVDYNGKTSVGTEINMNANPAICKVERGKWHKYELFMHNNTPGQADGTAQLWMDGVKCIDQSGIHYVNEGEINKWEQVAWSPTWGGVNDLIGENEVFYEYMDHIYISGK